MNGNASSVRFGQEYACVIKLINCYAAMHIKNEQKSFISQRLENDLKITEFAARAFADQKQIPFLEGLFEPTQPILTIIKGKSKWYPAEMYPDNITFLRSF